MFCINCCSVSSINRKFSPRRRGPRGPRGPFESGRPRRCDRGQTRARTGPIRVRQTAPPLLNNACHCIISVLKYASTTSSVTPVLGITSPSQRESPPKSVTLAAEANSWSYSSHQRPGTRSFRLMSQADSAFQVPALQMVATRTAAAAWPRPSLPAKTQALSFSLLSLSPLSLTFFLSVTVCVCVCV